MMDSAAQEDDPRVKIRPRYAISEFSRVLWHLRAVMGTLLLVFALLCVAMFYFGGAVDIAANKPASPGRVAYFCAITALTIGYGDVVPTTDVGRIIAILLGLQGMLITGVVTASAVYGVQAAAHRAGILPR